MWTIMIFSDYEKLDDEDFIFKIVHCPGIGFRQLNREED